MSPTKKPSLAAALQAASKKQDQVIPVVETGSTTGGAVRVPASRVGKKVVAGHFDPAVTKQLKQIALDSDSTVQSLLAEALNDLFEKYGKERIA
jgi:hypothetical protein